MNDRSPFARDFRPRGATIVLNNRFDLADKHEQTVLDSGARVRPHRQRKKFSKELVTSRMLDVH